MKNINILNGKELKELIPASIESLNTVKKSREQIKKILEGKDSRLLAIVGPCSIHDKKAAIEYANHLKELSDIVSEKIYKILSNSY